MGKLTEIIHQKMGNIPEIKNQWEYVWKQLHLFVLLHKNFK